MNGFQMKYPLVDACIANSRNRSGIKAAKREFCVVHDTGNLNSTARNNRNYLDRYFKLVHGEYYEADGSTPFRVASAHTFVDDKEILITVPWNEKAWHVRYETTPDNAMFGDDANDIAVGHELCYFDDPVRMKKAYDKFVWLNAYTAWLYGWPDIKRRLVGHDFLDPGRKVDPMNAFKRLNKTFDDFLDDVVREYNACTGRSADNATSGISYSFNRTYKERIYATGGNLVRCDGNYGVPASDVRFVRFRTGKTRYRFVYEKGAKVSELIRKHEADYAFNGPFFHNGRPLGDAEDRDVAVSFASGKMLNWHEFAVVGDKPAIGQLKAAEKQQLLVQGAPLLLERGQPVYEKYRVSEQVNDDIGLARCQRTFVGIDEAGDLWVFVADGRTSFDRGLTLEEMALFARSKGCVDALNLDGGGSSILCDKTGALNQKPNTGANERIVHHAMLVYLEPDQKEENNRVDAISVDLIDEKSGRVQAVEGFVRQGVSYAPVRAVGDFLGAKVGYDTANKKPSLTRPAALSEAFAKRGV